MIENCPECGDTIAKMPIREPIPESTTAMMTNITSATTDIGWPHYESSMAIYKCSNPKCWVTKITESWE